MFKLKAEQIEIKQAAREFAEKEFPKVVQECNREKNLQNISGRKALRLVQIERFPNIMLE